MGSGPLAQTPSYQNRRTNNPDKTSPSLGSDQITAKKRRTGSPGLAITLARNFQALQQHQPASDSPWHRSRGKLLRPHTHPHTHRGAEGGGGCLTSATAAPWQVQDGRCRPQWLVRDMLLQAAASRVERLFKSASLPSSSWPGPTLRPQRHPRTTCCTPQGGSGRCDPSRLQRPLARAQEERALCGQSVRNSRRLPTQQRTTRAAEASWPR